MAEAKSQCCGRESHPEVSVQVYLGSTDASKDLVVGFERSFSSVLLFEPGEFV